MKMQRKMAKDFSWRKYFIFYKNFLVTKLTLLFNIKVIIIKIMNFKFLSQVQRRL